MESCFTEAVIKAIVSMDELIEIRLAKVKDIELELVALGKIIKSKLFQSKNEYMLNRHHTGRKYKDEATMYKLKAKTISREKIALLDEAEKLNCVKQKFEACRSEGKEESKHSEFKRSRCHTDSIWRNRVTNAKYSHEIIQ